MKEQKIKFIVLVIIVMLIVYSTFFFITQQQIREIDNDIKILTDEPASVIIRADANSGTSPLTINFKPILNNINDNISYLWSFGDGATSNDIDPSHTYLDTGIFNCKLTVKNDNKNIMDSLNIKVYPNSPPQIKIKSSETTPFRPATIYFDADAFDPEGEELQYQWILKYPPLYGYEKSEEYNKKNFSKWLWRNGNYVVELNVTDESGNIATDYVIIQVGKSHIEQLIQGVLISYRLFLLPPLEGIWKSQIIRENITRFIDNYWLNLIPIEQKMISIILNIMHWSYIPPIPKAKLAVTNISDINLSKYVDSNTGKVKAGAVASNSFTIANNDNNHTAGNIYITLYNPFSKNERGLVEEIDVDGIYLNLDVGFLSNNLFYNGNYTNWKDCYNIEKLTPGSYITLNITVTLKEGTVFNKGLYKCKLYMYQEKSLDISDYIDEIPFTIKI